MYDCTSCFVFEAYKFTGKERDAESGLDYFGPRYYASNMGRWMSPDWADKPEAVPYSHLDDPQSLNLYMYVGNNPLSKPDLDGHGCPPDCSPLTPQAFGAFMSKVIDAGAATVKFIQDHPDLPAQVAVQAGIAVVTEGRGEVEMPSLTEGEGAVPSAPSMGAAQRQAMQDQGIPTSQQPATQTNTPAGRQYTYEVPAEGGNTQTKIVQRNNGTDSSHPGQPHVEAGSPKPGDANHPPPTDSIGRPRLDSNKSKVNVKKPDGS